MPQSGRTFRIFVSSTFSDLVAERNALQERVFPRLRELAVAHGCRLQAIDLRWGVSEEAALDQQTMKICLGEIERCRAVSPRPNFVVLLGDRFGWRPLPAAIPAAEFEALLPHLAEPEQALARWREGQPEDAQGWYRLDENAAPPEYVLLPRQPGSRYADYSTWESQVERPLVAALERGAQRAGLGAEALEKYTLSATGQEIVKGALQAQDARECVFCYFREIAGAPSDNAGSAFRDAEPAAAQGQAQLKARLKQHLPGNVHEYTAAWRGDGPSLDHLDALCAEVYADLSRVMLAEIGRIEAVDPLNKESAAHLDFAYARARGFVGRTDSLKAIADYVSQCAPQPLAICGASGSGKSALLAKAVLETEQAHTHAAVFARFVGATPDSSNGRALLEGLCKEITREYGGDESAVPTVYRELTEAFPKCLALARAEKPLILFLDALDQLGGQDRAHELAWLPVTLPAHVRLVLSTLPGQAWASLMERVPGSARLEVRAMLPSEGTEVLGAWLQEAGRDLTRHQRQDVLAKFERGGGLPLHLKLAFEEARRWHSYDGLPAHFDGQPGLGADIPEVLRDLFWRLEQESNHGKIMVARALGYLAAARNGLSEDELLDVLWADPAVQADFFRRSPKSPQELRALPVVIWSRLHLDLEPYLAWRQADGTELLGFYHRQLREAVEARYWAGQERLAQHRHLAAYFGDPERPFWLDAEQRKPDQRKTAEVAYQQAYAGLAAELHDTLTTFDFLNARLAAAGAENLIGDYDLALVSSPSSHVVAGEEGEGLRLIRDGLRLSAHVLAQDPDQLPCQLFGRLLGVDHSEVRCLLETARAFRHRPWLRPLTPCLTPPGGAELGTLITGHTATSIIHAVAPLPDGKRVLSGSFDGTLKLWDLETGAKLRTFIGHNNPIWAVAVLANGKQALAASSDGRLKLWDLETGGCLRTFVGPREPMWDVAVLADGMRALSASADRTLQLWDLRGGTVLRTFVGHTGWVKGVALLAGSRRAISASHDRTLRLWDMETGAELRTFNGHSGEVEAVAVTPDGLRALSASDDHTLRLWDLATGAELRTFSGHDGGVTSVAVLADGRRAISASHDRTLRLWDLETGKELRTFAGHTKGVSALSLLPDGRRAVSASSDMTLKLWDLETRFAQPSTGKASRVSAVTVLPDGQRALSATFDHTLKLWSLETGVELSTFTGHTGRVTAVALLADGQRALSASGDHTLRLWDLQTGNCLRTFAGHTGQVSAVVVLADGKRAISASEDHTLKLWDLRTGKALRTFVGHSDWVTAVAVLADGKRAISGSWSGDPMLWDLESGAMLRAFAGRSGGVTAVVVLADGKRALSASPDDSLTVWDVETGVELHTIPMPNKHDFALKLWLVPKTALTGIEHTSQVSAMAVQKDGKRAFSAYWNNTVKLWDLDSGIVQQTFTGHTEEVSGVALSADGRRGISVSGDHALKLWDLGTGACVCALFPRMDP